MRNERVLLLAALAALGLTIATAQRRPGTVPRAQEPSVGHAERGTEATSPANIPARGWGDILKRAAVQFSDHRIMTEAAGITFYALLAVFPALAALVSLYGLFADPNTIATQVDTLSGLLPGGGMDIIQAQLHTLTSNGSQTLGFALALSLATALWSANAGTKGLFDALNVVYDEREKRGYIRRTALSLAFTLGLLVFVLIAMAVVIALPVALNFVGVGETADTLLRLLRWPLLLLAVSGVLAFAYRFGPSRATARWTWVSWGSGFAAVTWVLGSAAFSWYVASFGSFNKTYGSLGAAVGFMTWIWLSAMIVLLGAELNAETEHQTAHDTTTGQPAPMGARGATKADTLPEFSRAE